MPPANRAPAATFNGQDGVKLREHVEAQCAAYRAHYDSRLVALDRLVSEGFASRDKALVVAFNALNAKMITENGVRDELTRQTATLITKTQYDSDRAKTVADIQDLRESRAEAAGKASQSSVNVALLLSVSGLVIGAISLLLKLVGG